MLLTKQQRIEIILMSGSSHKIAKEFNRKHSTSITHDTVAKLFVKFKKNGAVEDQRSGRLCTAMDEKTTVRVLEALTESPKKYTKIVC